MPALLFDRSKVLKRISEEDVPLRDGDQQSIEVHADIGAAYSCIVGMQEAGEGSPAAPRQFALTSAPGPRGARDRVATLFGPRRGDGYRPPIRPLLGKTRDARACWRYHRRDRPVGMITSLTPHRTVDVRRSSAGLSPDRPFSCVSACVNTTPARFGASGWNNSEIGKSG